MKEKALLFEEETLAHKIMVSKDPVEQKRLGKLVEKSSKFTERKWHSQAPKIIEQALQAKFEQNSGLGDWLLKTDDKVLVEATSDAFWGVGLRLQDKNMLVRRMWDASAVNCMGKALMQTRTWLRRKKALWNASLEPLSQSTPAR